MGQNKVVKNQASYSPSLQKVLISELVDNNGMNIFHVLLFDKGYEKWYTKKLENETRKKVVKFIEAFCHTIPAAKIVLMMSKRDNHGRTPLHYAGIIDGDDLRSISNLI